MPWRPASADRRVALAARGLARRALRAVDRRRGRIADRARGRGHGAHRQQHAADIGMMDDRRIGRCAARRPCPARSSRIGERLLSRRVRRSRRPARRPAAASLFIIVNMQSRPLLLLADETADRAVACRHRSWCRSATHECRAFARPKARRSLRSPSEPSPSSRNFGTRNSEMPRRTGRRIGQPRQHQVDDVVGEIVVAVGDEDLLAGDAVVPSRARALGARAQRAEVGAGLRLGQVHRAGPLAAISFPR